MPCPAGSGTTLLGVRVKGKLRIYACAYISYPFKSICADAHAPIGYSILKNSLGSMYSFLRPTSTMACAAPGAPVAAAAAAATAPPNPHKNPLRLAAPARREPTTAGVGAGARTGSLTALGRGNGGGCGWYASVVVVPAAATTTIASSRNKRLRPAMMIGTGGTCN